MSIFWVSEPLVLAGCVFSRFLQPGFLLRVSTKTLAHLLQFGWNQEELNLAWWPTSQMPSFHRTSGFFSAFLSRTCEVALKLWCPWDSCCLPPSLSLGGISRLIAPYWYLRIWTLSTPFSARWGINLKVSVVRDQNTSCITAKQDLRRQLGSAIQMASFPSGLAVKNLPAMQEIQVWPLGWEDPLEKEMAIHSSILIWKIPRTEETGRLKS